MKRIELKRLVWKRVKREESRTEGMSGEKGMRDDNRTKRQEDKRSRVGEEKPGMKRIMWIEMT